MARRVGSARALQRLSAAFVMLQTITVWLWFCQGVILECIIRRGVFPDRRSPRRILIAPCRGCASTFSQIAHMPALFRLSIFNSRFSGRHVWGLPQRVGGETLVFKQALSVWRDVFRTLIARISRRHLPIDQTGELLMAIGGPGGIHEASAGGIT